MIKKVVAIIVFILVASLSVAGCTSSNTSPSPSAQAASSAATAVQNTSSDHQAVDISVHYFGSPKSIGPFNVTPRDGYKWAVYNVTIKNINETDYLVLDTLFSLNSSDGNRTLTAGYFVNYTEALGWNTTPTSDTHLRPGETASGTIVFQVPENVSPVIVTYESAYMNGKVFSVDVRTFDALAK